MMWQHPSMPEDAATYIGAVAEHGRALADAAERVDLAASVPDCPGWTVRSVLEHTTMVHRWAARHLQEGQAAPLTSSPTPSMPDEDLRRYYREGHASLVDALTEAPDDLEAMRFLHDPPPARVFWARRQAHETAIHRSDVDVAAGTPPTFDPDFATDGIDELVMGFLPRRKSRLVSSPPCTLGIRATDTGRSWHLTIGPESRHVRRADVAGADCVISGPAAGLYPFLWNRTVAVPPTIYGDARIHELWRAKAHVTWS